MKIKEYRYCGGWKPGENVMEEVEKEDGFVGWRESQGQYFARFLKSSKGPPENLNFEE